MPSAIYQARQDHRQDYETVGMVTAAPYGGKWFHAHFCVSKEPLRLIGWYGPNNHRKDRPGVLPCGRGIGGAAHRLVRCETGAPGRT